MKATVFLGGGRITGALIAGLRLSNDRRRIVVYDRHPDKLRRLKKTYGIVPEPDLQMAVAQADLLMVAVRPDSVRDLLRDIGQVERPLVAISLAAGVPLANLRQALGPPVRWVRAMPSPVFRSGSGLTGLCFDHAFPARAKSAIRNLFSRAGQIVEVPESQFDAFTVTYSSSHGYHALATLAGAAEKLGLKPGTALLAAAHALADGILAWRRDSISLRTLMNEAATPGGIAAEVIAAADRSGYRKAVERALMAGMRRARQNAKGGQG